MKKLILLLLFIPILSCSSDDGDDEIQQEVKNTYKLTIRNTDYNLIYSKVELAGHSFEMTSNEQSFEVDGDIVSELTNKVNLIDIDVKLYYECTPCSDVRGCNYDETVSVDFLKNKFTRIKIVPRTDGMHQFNACAHLHEVGYY